MDLFNYFRRETTEVNIGAVPLGGPNSIRIQSMTNTSTQDTQACVDQAKRIVDAGGEYVRLTTQGIKEAENLMNINIGLRSQGYMVPLVADVHFNPKVADVAAQYAEKVRINPGNYVDAARTFKKLEYTDEEYAQEIQKIHDRFVPFLNICKENHTAIRIGVNHGSLSDRIMSRYGDTPEGMVESCMEFLRICVEENFTDVVISIKASNTVVMVKTVRLLVDVMEKEGMAFPLHLGVTEAGDGEDGRIKSALGIGALLSDGLGDTIRVSLSEAPEAEIPVARKLVDYVLLRQNHPYIPGLEAWSAWVTPPVALFLGLIFALTCGQAHPKFNKKTSKYLLQYSVVGLGFGMNLHSALASGKEGMEFTVISVIGTLVIGWFIGRKLFKIDRNTAYLISSGTAICGGSAIAAVGPVLKAKDSEMSVALGTIFILNAIALFIFPAIGHALNMDQQQFGTWAAIAIHDTSSVVGAGAAYGEEALKVATTIKLTRALWIIPMAFATSFIFKSKGQKISIPWFILFFVLALVVNTYLLDGVPQLGAAINGIARKTLTITMFFIGASLSIDVLKAVGIKPLIQGILLWVIISLSTLAYIYFV